MSSKTGYIINYSHGFTLIELVVVILIIGILSVVAVPRWTATGINVNYEAYRILNDIRYAQALSMTTGLRYRWIRISSNAYQIQNESGAAINLPTGGNQYILASGITIATMTNLPSSLIAFDSQGIPYTTSSIPGAALAGTAVITVTGGGASKMIQISPETGYGVIP